MKNSEITPDVMKALDIERQGDGAWFNSNEDKKVST